MFDIQGDEDKDKLPGTISEEYSSNSTQTSAIE